VVSGRASAPDARAPEAPPRPGRLVALSLPVLALFAVAARKPDHPKHENHDKAVSTPGAGELASKGPSIFGKALVLIPPGDKLMPSKNDFTAGPFSCNLTDHNYKTDFSIAAFTWVYNGTGVGFIDARKISARSKSGTMYANLNKKAKRDVVLPGEKAKCETNIVIPASDADMQFVTYNLVFGDSFTEAATTPVTVADWNFDIDAAKTLDANK
jgi:hypothetical protein